ncbi:MAG: hypothetical protein J5858_11750 [Lentisphaeria bacterium]|nr:hypothetical protein [Lentisphaeria bacterium]
MDNKTSIYPIRGSILNSDLAEGIAVFIPPGMAGIRLESESFLSMFGITEFRTREIVVRVLAALEAGDGIVRCIVYADNQEREIRSVDDMRAQVFATLEAFEKAGAKTIAMNGIRCDSRPDMNARSEAYQKRFVEEYVAAHPDAFDVIYLVDLRGGFNRG